MYYSIGQVTMVENLLNIQRIAMGVSSYGQVTTVANNDSKPERKQKQ